MTLWCGQMTRKYYHKSTQSLKKVEDVMTNNFFKLYNLPITEGDKLNASKLVKMVYIRQFDTKCILLSLQ